MDPAAYVLRDFSATERKELDLVVETAADAAESLCTVGLERTQTAFNS
jgi:PTH1 family peptidyl-tRNA hydrolase